MDPQTAMLMAQLADQQLAAMASAGMPPHHVPLAAPLPGAPFPPPAALLRQGSGQVLSDNTSDRSRSGRKRKVGAHGASRTHVSCLEDRMPREPAEPVQLSRGGARVDPTRHVSKHVGRHLCTRAAGARL
jgi:hypothetical protein